jgi:hypothetical protein
MRSRPYRLPLVVPFVALGSALTGCPGSLADPGEFEMDGSVSRAEGGTTTSCAASVPTTIFQDTCGVSSCHNPKNIASMDGLDVHGLDLYSPGVASRLVNVPSIEVPSDFLVNSKTPYDSYLLLKLMPNPPVGIQMPYGGSLTAAQIACVTAWVDLAILDAGAPPPMEGGSSDGTASTETGPADASTTDRAMSD